MSEPVLEADHVSVVQGNQTILDDVSLTISPTARTLIQGPSGAGKTTLFNVLGLLDTPSSGTLRVDGVDASSLAERERARLRRETIGFVFQEFHLIGDLTAWENAALPQEHAGERDENRLAELFEELDIDDLRGQYPATLSGGEKQRVAIARALANDPAVVLADEPTGQLDPDTTDQVLDFLLDLQQAAETALVTISHDQRLASHFGEVLALEVGGTLRDSTRAPEVARTTTDR
jgi:putative ABC transport system ATP-binding protein